jgi:hypothetical protein
VVTWEGDEHGHGKHVPGRVSDNYTVCERVRELHDANFVTCIMPKTSADVNDNIGL